MISQNMQSHSMVRRFRHIKLLCLILVLNGYSSLKAQNSPLKLPEYSLHSPEAANLGKYGDYQVNYSTGVPSISVPVYTIKTAQFELPITASYHAGGIKVDEEASSLGLGWTLMTGGAISRIIQDRCDEVGTYGFLQGGGSLADYNGIEDVDLIASFGTNTYLRETAFPGWDKEPDVFRISANGLAGEFFANNAGQFITSQMESYKIEVNWSTNSFIITNELGVVYRFGRSVANVAAYETTSITTATFDREPTADAPNPQQPYTSSWYLTEIISADRTDTVFFEYTPHYFRAKTLSNATRYIINDPINFSSRTDFAGNLFDGLRKVESDMTMMNMQVISRIRFKGGEATFHYANDRLDQFAGSIQMPKKARLTHIVVKDNRGYQFRRINFSNNAYYNRTASGHSSFGLPIPDYDKKSLKLEGIDFYDADNAKVNGYTFEYDATPLPPRNTTPQDHWGFYNGKATNTTLIPHSFYTQSVTGKPIYVGEDRSTDFTYMKAGVLTKINYPTGGSTVYEFEPNYYLKEIQQNNMIERTRQYSLFAINRHTSCDPDYFTGVPASNTLQFTVNDQLENGGVEVGKMVIVFSDYLVYSGNHMVATLVNQNTNETYTRSHGPAEMGQQVRFEFDVTIRQGHTYLLTINTNGNTGSNTNLCNSPTIETYLHYRYWESSNQSTVSPTQAGGLRVKSITKYSALDVLASKRVYEYGATKYGPNQIGVGTLRIDPNKHNFYWYPLLYQINNDEKTLVRLLWFSSNSMVPLGSNAGCPVDYAQVTEIHWGVTSNESGGKTVYYYDRPDGMFEPRSSINTPYSFVNYPSWRETQLLKLENYEATGPSSYQLINSKEYTYTELAQQRIKTLKIFEYEPDIHYASRQPPPYQSFWQYVGNNPERFHYYNYHVSRGRIMKTTETEKQYVNGVLASSVTRTFAYNSKYELAQQTEVNSRGETIQTKRKYTSDLNYTTLHNQNMLSLAVQTETTLDGKVIQGAILKYNDYGAPTHQYNALQTGATPVTYSSKDVLPGYYQLQAELIYNSILRRPAEIWSRGTPKKVLLWSYQNQYPIAQIENTTENDVKAVLGSTAIQSFAYSLPTETSVHSFLAPLWTDSRMNKSMVTGYTHLPLFGLTSMKDPRQRMTYFSYDSYGRLQHVRDHEQNIIKQLCYNYYGQTEKCITLYTSSVQSQVFRKNNCGHNYTGSLVTYTVPAGTYQSYISQAHADMLAQTAIAANGQAYANANGTCVLSCDGSNCSGQNKKCLNGVCELGVKVYTGWVYIGPHNYQCTYHYEWSDGSWSPNYTEQSATPCMSVE